MTILASATAALGFAVYGCPSWSIDGAAQLICHGSETGGVAPGLGTAVWAWAAAATTLLSVWIPVAVAGRKKLARSTAAFTENLDRVKIHHDEETMKAREGITARLETAQKGSASEKSESIAETSDVYNDDGREQAAKDPEKEVTVLDLVLQELARLEGLAATGTMSPREWVALLVEINSLHNDGVLDTDTFKTINTRLIGLVANPVARAEGRPDVGAQRELAGV